MAFIVFREERALVLVVRKMGKNDRPTGLTIIAILLMILGMFSFATALYLYSSHYFSRAYGGSAVLAITMIFGLIIVGAILLVLGYEIWKGSGVGARALCERDMRYESYIGNGLTVRTIS